MKDKTIKAMAERVGQTRAEKFWALFVERLCDGIEPEDGDTFKREDIEKRFENNPVARDAFIAVLCGEQKPETKGRKFKAEKARTYSAMDLAAFIAADPKVEGLRAEYMRRTGGEPALFYVDGKLCETESADRIQRLFERDPVAPFVIIGGREVTPVGYPEEDAKEDAEDPYQRGVALGQPGDVSERLGVSLAAIPHDTMQAIACAVEKDLADASKAELQRDAAAAKGKTPAEYLMNKPLARRAWPSWPKPTLRLKRRPKAPVPFVEPSAPTAPRGGVKASADAQGTRVFVLGAGIEAKNWEPLWKLMARAIRANGIQLTTDDGDFDHGIAPGSPRSKVIAERLRQADVVMFLMSPSTMGTDIPEQVGASGGRIIPVIVGSVSTQYTPLEGKVCLPRNGEPARDDAARVALVNDIMEAILQPRAQRPVFDRDAVHRAIVGLALDRDTLARSIDPRLAAQIPGASPPSAQVLSDLTFLDRLRASGDAEPLRNYIGAALTLSPLRRESAVFRAALEAL